MEIKVYPKRFVEVSYLKKKEGVQCYSTSLFDLTEVHEPFIRISDITRTFFDSYIDGEVDILSFNVFYPDGDFISP